MPHSSKPNDDQTWDRFLSVVARLRGDNGCPWDKEQTYSSLTKYVLEEAHELVEAVLEKDVNKIKEELGDLLLEVALYCVMAQERGDFEPSDVFRGIIEKLVRRHPHVFGEETIASAQDVRKRWDEIKRSEPGRYKAGHSLMDEMQKGLPALMTAQKQQALAAGVGFDWGSSAPVFHKVREELEELIAAQTVGRQDRVQGEVGDLLFACVNLSRHLGVDAEIALLGTIEKFSRRFRYIERSLGQDDLTLDDANLELLDELWEKAKLLERSE